MLFLCEASCTADGVVNGKRFHHGFMRGRIYDEAEIGVGPWQRYFRPVSEKEAATLEERRREESKPPQYLKPVKKPEQDVSPLLHGLNVKPW